MKFWKSIAILSLITLMPATQQPLRVQAAARLPQEALPPEDWVTWPVVPAVTPTAREIYQRGLELGNNPHHFSKIGDCQAIHEVLMGNYDLPGAYVLSPEEQYLQETIDYFRGSFYRDGFAVKGGFDAIAVFNPMRADPDWCRLGETPLQCEFRVHKPSFVIITLEYPFKGRTSETYEAYIRQVIDYSIEKGVVPILSTKADNVENYHTINLTTAKLAAEYDLPLWNFWRSVQGMSNNGLDASPGRNDGFHISYAAWNVRAFTALQTIDAMWRGVRDLTPAEAPVPVYAPSVNAGKLVFGLSSRSAGQIVNKGVYVFNTRTQEVTELLGEGSLFQDVSPDGLALLVSQGSQLFEMPVAGGDLRLISDTLAPGTGAARYLPDGLSLAVIDQRAGQAALYLLNRSGDPAWKQLNPAGTSPAVIDSLENSRILWSTGTCSSWGTCSLHGSWSTDLKSGQSRQPYALAHSPLASPNGRYLLYSAANALNRQDVYIAGRQGESTWIKNMPERDVVDYDWSPDSSSAAVLFQARGTQSGSVSDARLMRLRPADRDEFEFISITGVNPKVRWSPDGATLLLISTLPLNGRYALYLRWFSARATGQYEETRLFEGDEFIYINNIRWVR